MKNEELTGCPSCSQPVLKTSTIELIISSTTNRLLREGRCFLSRLLSDVSTIDNRILIYLDTRSPIKQPCKMLPPEVESARHFDLNITQRELPLVMRHLNSQSRHCRLDEMCVRNCNEIFLFFIFLFCKDFYVTYVLM